MNLTAKDIWDNKYCFSIAMWEYSWLTQRSGRQSEYKNWDIVLDEVVKRRYDCLRIDAQPHCIARDKQGNIHDKITYLPIDPNFMWGHHTEVTISPRIDLICFLQKMKDRNLLAGLSSWFLDDTKHLKYQLDSPEEYARIWIETLNLLKEKGFSDMILWIDICNEFPAYGWSPEPFKQITGPKVYKKKWSPDGIKRLEEYYKITIKLLKESHPEFKYTFSSQFEVDPNVYMADLSPFDLLDPHIWITDDAKWNKKSNYQSAIDKPYPEGLVKHARTAEKLYKKGKNRTYDILNRRIRLWGKKAKELGIPIITTEGWATVFYEDLSHCGFTREWDWIKELTKEAIIKAIDNGWSGICTSNFAEPHFEGLWYDIEWHQKMNKLIKDSRRRDERFN